MLFVERLRHDGRPSGQNTAHRSEVCWLEVVRPSAVVCKVESDVSKEAEMDQSEDRGKPAECGDSEAKVSGSNDARKSSEMKPRKCASNVAPA